MMKTNAKRKNSAVKKLIPAAGMLALSASMLATSTYAWFTMSREVELKNIQMTASAPSNVQISLGLGQSTGALTAKDDSTAPGVELVAAPKNDDTSLDWNNTVAFYDYYNVPAIKPSSSNTGGSIFAVPDANITNVGKTVANGTAVNADEAIMTLADASNSANTAALTAQGHYIEFPVWFRTAATGDVTLKVEAVASVGANNIEGVRKPGADDTNKLYRAARVAVLNTTNGTTWTSSSNVIVPKDGNTAQTLASKYYAKNDSNVPLALKAAAAYTSTGETNRGGDAYGAVSAYNGTDAVVTVIGKGSNTAAQYAGNCSTTTAGTTDKVYGAATCAMLRVWLEGEDVDCWNATAGQDFQINLKFTVIEGN